MLGRLFGRGKDERSEAVCAECGRTLLAGEWTHRVTDDRGDEMVLCSLCGQAHPLTGGERPTVRNGTSTVRKDTDGTPPEPQPASRAEGSRDQRGESDALWKAIKDRDAEIERLAAQLAHAEAQRQELLGTVAGLKLQLQDAAAPRPDADAEDEPFAPATEAEPMHAAGDDFPLFDDEQPAEADALGVEAPPADLPEDTAEISAAEAAAEGLAVRDDAPWQPVAEQPHEEVQEDHDARAGEPPPDESDESQAEAPQGDAQTVAEVEAEAASLTLLQRGVDLLNVSTVPRKVAETTADLGLPGVHVAFDGLVVTATFLWNMGWYRYTVELETGGVRLEERGYEERDDLRPNGTVRGDGTVQLAPAQISRAAAQRLQQPQRPQPAPPVEAEEPEAQPAPPVGGPEILSKSLLGQRTDDEPLSWEQTRARDFTWD